MSRVPRERPAARDLQRQFAALGSVHGQLNELERDLRTGRRRRRLGMRGLVAAGSLMTLVAAAAGADKVLVGPSAPVPDETEHRFDRAAPRDTRLAEVTAPDPRGGPAWGVRVYVDTAGNPCLVLGRVLDGRLGIVDNEQFRPLPPDATGSFTDRSGHLAVLNRRYGAALGPTQVLYGYADRTIEGLTLLLIDKSIPIKIGNDGVYIVAFAGTNPL